MTRRASRQNPDPVFVPLLVGGKDLTGGAPAAWYELAACREVSPEIFFPEGHCESTKPAKRICAGCEVKAECLAEVAEAEKMPGVGQDGVPGVWGGLSQQDRARLAGRGRVVRRSRAAAKAAKATKAAEAAKAGAA